jgi:hypothetical protein
MGAHYGSIQIRSTDQKAVVKSVETIARARNIKCLVGPAFNGWVGVYPESNGQDDAVGADIAKEFGGTAIHILIHDDDVMAYWLWRDGQLCDSYYSKPGYFGEAQRAKEESMAGTPEQFESIIGEKTEALKEILRRDRKVGALESERLDDFAKLLGITNALTAYEYLKEEECEGVKGRRKFQEVPGDLARAEAEQKKRERLAANKQAREERRRVETWRDELRSSGVLLRRSEDKHGNAHTVAVDGGFVTAWPDFGIGRLEICGPPWHEKKRLDIELPGVLRALCVDQGHRYVGVGTGPRATIFHVAEGQWTQVSETVLDDEIWHVAVSAGATHVACSTQTAITVIEMASGRNLLEIPAENGGHLCMHPQGRHLMAILRSGIALLISLQDTLETREIYFGGKTEVPWGSGLPGVAFREFDIDAIVAEQQDRIDLVCSKLAHTIRKASNTGKGSAEASLEMSQIRKHMQRQHEWQLRRLKQLNANRGVTIKPNEQISSCAFTADGKFLCVATDMSLSVFDWQQFMQSGDPLPQPLLRLPFDRPPHIHRIEPEIGQSGILFASQSKIYRMDLKTGKMEDLFHSREWGWVSGLAFSEDGQFLSVQHVGRQGQGSKLAMQGTGEIWSYPEFRRGAGLLSAGKP